MSEVKHIIALLAALETEMAPTLRRIGVARLPASAREDSRCVATGTYRGAAVDAYISGMGRQRTQACIASMLAARPPSAVIHLGFAGGLNPALGTGAVIEPDDEAGMTLMSLERPVLDPAEKAQLYASQRADAVDMETHAAAELLGPAGVRHLVIRAITDSAKASLPPEAVRWVGPYGRIRALCVAGDLLSQPLLFHKMWTLRRAARTAGHALAERVTLRLDELIADLNANVAPDRGPTDPPSA